MLLIATQRRPARGLRRTVAHGLRAVAVALFYLAGLPIDLGRMLLRAAGRLNGAAYNLELEP